MKLSVHQVLLGLEDQSKIDSRMHAKHPAVLLLTVVLWLLCLSSFHRHALFILVPYGLFVYYWLLESNLNTKLIGSGLLKAEPFIVAIALLNPIMERDMITVLGYHVPSGFITAVGILIKGNMSVLLTLCLMATLGINGLAEGLTALKFPKILVDTVVMTYRYILTFTEEVQTRWHAYALRVPDARGIALSAAGSFIGQLFIRSMQRGALIHEAMALRGATVLPPYHTQKPSRADYRFILIWGGFSIGIKLLSYWI